MIARRPTRFIGHGLLLLNCRRPAARPPQRASILCRALPRSRDTSSRPPADGALAARPATTAAWPCRSIPAVRVQSVRPRRLGRDRGAPDRKSPTPHPERAFRAAPLASGQATAGGDAEQPGADVVFGAGFRQARSEE